MKIRDSRLLRKNLRVFTLLIIAIAFTLFTSYPIFAHNIQSKASVESISRVIQHSKTSIDISEEIISMSESKCVNVTVDFGYEPNLNDLVWKFGEKKFSEWKCWNPEKKDFSGKDFITFFEEPSIDDNKVTAKVKFDLLFSTTDLAPRSIRHQFQDYIGTYDLEVADMNNNIKVSYPMYLNVYDEYHTYEQFKPTIEEIKKAANNRYVNMITYGKTYEGRDMNLVIVAKDKESVDKYLNETVDLKLNNPVEMQNRIKNANLGDYKEVIWFNNIHPDESPDIDAIFNLIKDFATEEEISYKTLDNNKMPNSIDVTYNVDEILDKVILLFNLTENPDGRVYNTRQNSNGFDLNRDNTYQTQIETQNLSSELSKWMPISLIDYHGFMSGFLIEPCTGPHNANFEMDLLMDGMIGQAEAMGKAGIANTKYETYTIPLMDWDSGWDDATPSYTSTFAMAYGIMGHTVEVPELNSESVKALTYAGYGVVKYIADNREELLNNQLEIFRRGIENEDNKLVDIWLTDQQGFQIGRPRGQHKNFYPEYYLIPVDGSLQRNKLEGYKMVKYLIRNGVKVEQTTEAVKVVDDNKRSINIPEGSFIVDMHQAKRNFANIVLHEGEDSSDYNAMYDSIVTNFPDLRGFNKYEIRVQDAFKGKTSEVYSLDIPATELTKNSVSYIIKNSNNDAVKAVNELLESGKEVMMVTKENEKCNIGDYVVSKIDLNSLKDKYLLEVIPLPDNIESKEIKKVKIAAASAHAKFVLKELGFELVDENEEADVVVGDSYYAGITKEELLDGKPYIGIGGYSLEAIKKFDVLPGYNCGLSGDNLYSYEGLLNCDITQNDIITSGYCKDDLLYVANGGFITSVPEKAVTLAKVVNEDDYFISGWWPNHEMLKGQILAFKYKDDKVNVVLFANDLVYKAHTAQQFRMLSNAIYSFQIDK